MFEDEVGKYKKRSTAKGLPRSKHKHKYETVLLKTPYTLPDIKTGKTKIHIKNMPTRVCTICGRVEYVDRSPCFYQKTELAHLPFPVYSHDLSEAAWALPKWQVVDSREKFATPVEEEND